jgi:hypothetical protein
MVCSTAMDDHSSVTELRTGALPHKEPPPRAAAMIAKARVLRAEHAQAAAYQARRAEQARAAANHKEAARWTAGYRCSVARCRLLGEVIRGGGSRSLAGATASTVTPLATRKPARDIPTPGEAA